MKETPPIKSLGHYFKQKMKKNPDMVEAALLLQEQLENNGTYKPLGAILAEKGEKEREIVQQCLLEMRVDILNNVTIFEDLHQSEIHTIARQSETMIVPQETLVYPIPESTEFYYVVASGSVRVHMTQEENDVTFANLSAGEGFGELAILSNTPSSASITTNEITSLIKIPGKLFLKTIFNSPKASKTMAVVLSDRLSRENLHLMEESRTGHAYRQFISEKINRDSLPLVGTSPRALQLKKEIRQKAQEWHMLIIGEPGTEMTGVAAMVYQETCSSHSMYLGMDVKELHGHKHDIHDLSSLEKDGESLLFGRKTGAMPSHPHEKLGLIPLSQNGVVIIENIEDMCPHVQKKLADYIEYGEFTPLGGVHKEKSETRIIATTTIELLNKVSDGTFDSRLFSLLFPQMITIPPLRKRKKDIAPMVDEFIRICNTRLDKKVTGIDDEAFNILMGYNWPMNTDELFDVIQRAVNMSRENILTSEQIFISSPSTTGIYTFNLLRVKNILNLFKSKFYPGALRVITGVVFTSIIVMGLWGPVQPEKNISLVMTWGLWEPILIFSVILLSRIWCGVCPIGALGETIQKFVGLNSNVPSFIKKYGYYFSAGGIAVIYMAEYATDMHNSPRATAGLILSITILAVITAFLFQRRTWCRYLCPLGSIMGTFATSSIIELRANRSICSNTCQNHECYTGSEDHSGCPMYEGPFILHSNQNCILCGNCIKTCPNNSPVLNLRLPFYDLWATMTPDRAVVLFVQVLLATQLFRCMILLGYTGPLTGFIGVQWVNSLLMIVAAFLFMYLLCETAGEMVFENIPVDRADALHLFVYSIVPLVLAIETACHMNYFFALTGDFLVVLANQIGLMADIPRFSVTHGAVTFFQVATVGGGMMVSHLVLKKIITAQDTYKEQTYKGLKQTWPVLIPGLLFMTMAVTKAFLNN
jgi:transcriptional regulator with AAA-type ATPase domain/NAD-dependent dihydropyrimidine dehydrogenase PreA subunit